MSDNPTSAMIFAAGFGTRMGPLTETTPKPMLPLAGKPMVDHAVGFLRDCGIDRIVANTHYLHDEIAPHLADLGVQVSHERDAILDTGGGLKAALPLLGHGPVITLNPDAAWNGANPIRTLLDAWQPEYDALLLVAPLDHALGRQGSGDFSLRGGRLVRSGPYVYTGAQIINPRLLLDISEEAFSLNRVWDALIGRNALRATVYDGHWCDIGHPAGLEIAERLLRSAHVPTK